jgi:hypothetical protein
MCSKFTQEGMLNFYAGATYARRQYNTCLQSTVTISICMWCVEQVPLENRMPTVRSIRVTRWATRVAYVPAIFFLPTNTLAIELNKGK